MKYKVFIDGKEGTTGLRIVERLSIRDDIELLEISEELRKDPVERAKLMNMSDIVFLCLPDQAAIEAVKLVTNDKTKIIDASTAHRTNPLFSYGFPELGEDFRNNLKNSKRVSVPGCHASGIISLIYPLIKNNVYDKNHQFYAISLTGYSGGGKKMIKQYNEDDNILLKAPRIYGLSQNHKHLKEIKHICSLENDIIFSPIVDDYYQGMLCELLLSLDNTGYTIESLHQMYKDFYKDSKFIKVKDIDYNGEDGFMSANSKKLMDDMEIAIYGNGNKVTVMSRFDNLGKGASGSAIQCLNIMLGKEEDYCLEVE